MRILRGWPIVGWAALLLAGMSAAILGWSGDAGPLRLVRATARVSVTLFCLAFVASSLHARWPGRSTRWLRANRRQVGVSFALSHAVHLAALLSLARGSLTALVDRSGVVITALGAIGYLFVAAMAATSSDRAVALLGPGRWRALHTFGGYVIWGIFVATFLPRAARSAPHAFFTLLLLATVVLRIAAARATQRERHAASSARPAGS